MTARIIELASRYGRYGYRRITALLRQEGWKVNHKRVERIWRREGLKVPQKQPKRGRLWLTDGSCIRLRPQHKDHVWSYDIVMERTSDGRAFRILTILDEYTRECLAILVARHIRSQDVIDQLFYLFLFRGIPEHIRSDNGPLVHSEGGSALAESARREDIIHRAGQSLGEWICGVIPGKAEGRVAQWGGIHHIVGGQGLD